MARRKADGVSQSDFIRELLNANQDVKHRVVADAWKVAGYPGEIKSSLFYLVKNKMGLAPAKRGRPGRPRKPIVAAPSAPSVTNPAAGADAASIYREIESKLDGLVRRAMDLRDHSLAEKLLAARRRASIKLV
jgi:hypothetical protein